VCGSTACPIRLAVLLLDDSLYSRDCEISVEAGVCSFARRPPSLSPIEMDVGEDVAEDMTGGTTRDGIAADA
jgi:hypothetical protein